MTNPTTTLPEEVWILGHRFTISNLDSPVTIKFIRSINPNYTGPGWSSICFRDDWITIADKGEQMARETLLHEIVHGIDHMLRDRPGGQERTTIKTCEKCIAKKDRVYLDEQTVLAWSRGLFATLTDPRNIPVRNFIFGGTP